MPYQIFTPLPFLILEDIFMKIWWGYFSRPFPGTHGFSAYRFPGIIVHLPIMVFVTACGFLLCANHTWLLPLIPFYLIFGLYIGRDLAIYSHYNLLITLAVVAGLIFLPSYAGSIKELITAIATPLHGLYSFLISTTIITGFYFYVRHWVNIEKKQKQEEEARAFSPLHYAAETGALQRCHELLAMNADLNPGKHDAMTPLHRAAANGHTKVLVLLLDYGADINLKTHDEIERNRDCTPLHYAAENGRDKVVKLLLQRGAAINTKTFHQYTALHYAALHGQWKIAKRLVQAGADISTLTADGKTALNLAESFGHKKIAGLLRKDKEN